MNKILYQVCSKLAACALFAAVISVGTASCAGMYEPELPEELRK